jgi:hypothetical protein
MEAIEKKQVAKTRFGFLGRTQEGPLSGYSPTIGPGLDRVSGSQNALSPWLTLTEHD